MDIIYDFDSFIPDVKKVSSEYMLRDPELSIVQKLKRIPSGLATKYCLKQVDKHARRGEVPEAETWATWAYTAYGGIISGVPWNYLESFTKDYAKYFSEDGKKVLEKLSKKNTPYLLSGGIQQCAEIVLNKQGITAFGDRVHCNSLDIEQGIIRGMEHKIATPTDKIKILESLGVDVKKSAVISCGDFWGLRLIEEAQIPIIIDVGNKAPNYTTLNANVVFNGKVVHSWPDVEKAYAKLIHP